MGKGGKGKSGQKSGGGNGGGKKGGGKNASLGARLTKVENQTARLKAWHTMSCKGFELRPYHAWKKDKLVAYVEENGKDDDRYGFGGSYADYADHDDERGSDHDMSGDDAKEMLRSSSKTMTKLLQADADPITNFTPNESQATQSQKIQNAPEVSAADLKRAEEEINPEELSVSMWKAEVIGTIIERCRKQSVKAGEPKHELVLRTDAETGRQMKVRTKMNAKWTENDEKKCAELLKGLLDMLSYLQQGPGLIDFIAVYEKSQYTDITIKSNHIGAQIATILQAKGLNATEKYSFESFVKENVPRTDAQAKDHEKKVKATARKDMEKASTMLQVDAGGEMDWDLDDAGAGAASAAGGGSSSSTARNGGRRGKGTAADPGASTSSNSTKQNKTTVAGQTKRKNAAGGATAAGAAGGGPPVKKPK